MPSDAAAELARELVGYDPQLARTLLVQIVDELGGPEPDGDDVAKLTAYLTRMQSPAERTATTTAEWKAEFAHLERLRSLGLALAARL